jgi:hypothetical protein
LLEAARETEPAAQVAKIIERANPPPNQTSASDADKQRENEAKYKAIAKTIIDRFSTDDIRFLLNDVWGRCCCGNCLSQVFIETEAGQNAPASQSPLETNDNSDSESDIAPPEQIAENVLYTIDRMNENARVCHKHLKMSVLDRETAARINAAIDGMIKKWRSIQSTIKKES